MGNQDTNINMKGKNYAFIKISFRYSPIITNSEFRGELSKCKQIGKRRENGLFLWVTCLSRWLFCSWLSVIMLSNGVYWYEKFHPNVTSFCLSWRYNCLNFLQFLGVKSAVLRMLKFPDSGTAEELWDWGGVGGQGAGPLVIWYCRGGATGHFFLLTLYISKNIGGHVSPAPPPPPPHPAPQSLDSTRVK